MPRPLRERRYVSNGRPRGRAVNLTPLTVEQRALIENNQGLIRKVLVSHGFYIGHDLHDDLFQDLVLCMVRVARGFNPALGFKFSTYAYRALVNRLNQARSKVRARELTAASEQEDAIRLAADPRPAAEMLESEAREQYERAMACLPERERMILVLRHEEGMTLEEVGGVFGGLSRERIRQLEARALDRCRKALGAA